MRWGCSPGCGPTYTGGRVIGLTTSTNASRVLKAEMDDAGAELAESYNIAQFVGKIEGSDELRWPVPVHEGDVIVIDEATQASTADFALVQQAARRAGAFLHPIGDTAQLGAVEAGGIFHLLVEDLDGPELTEILRFRHQWERDASVRIRAGQVQAIDVYDRRGRVRGADTDAAMADAAKSYLSDLLRGRDVLLLAGSNGEAAELARQVQGMLRMMGRVGEGQVDLSDGNTAGVGDRIRARLNASIDADGQLLSNRDTLRITKVTAGSVVAQRKTGPDTWSGQFTVPAAYLADNAELDYAGNAHVAQGRTVDVGHLLVSQTLSRRGLYVGMTRGRHENFAHVETGSTAPPGKPAYEQATVESVIKGVMEREASGLSATEQLRAAQEWAGGSGHVLHLWSETIHRSLYPQIDRQVMARLTPDQAHRYEREFAREAFHTRLREAQLAGYDIGELVDRITADSLDGARSISSVLHSRLDGLCLTAQPEATWEQRTPFGAPQLSRDLAAGLDDRARELGVRAAERPQPWLLDRLGVLPPDASPALRADYERRAGIAASYREAAGITDPRQAIAVEPHTGNPELETFRRSAMIALEIPDEQAVLRSMTVGQLEAAVAEGDRAVAFAPPEVSANLHAAAQAQADAWAQNAEAQAKGTQDEADGARDLAELMREQQAGLEPKQAAYESWSEATAEKRDVAGKAAAELARRQAEQGVDDVASLVDWWRQFEADAEAADRAIAAQQQAALDAGLPWPPERARRPHRRMRPNLSRAGGRCSSNRLRRLTGRSPRSSRPRLTPVNLGRHAGLGSSLRPKPSLHVSVSPNPSRCLSLILSRKFRRSLNSSSHVRTNRPVLLNPDPNRNRNRRRRGMRTPNGPGGSMSCRPGPRKPLAGSRPTPKPSPSRRRTMRCGSSGRRLNWKPRAPAGGGPGYPRRTWNRRPKRGRLYEPANGGCCRRGLALVAA